MIVLIGLLMMITVCKAVEDFAQIQLRDVESEKYQMIWHVAQSIMQVTTFALIWVNYSGFTWLSFKWFLFSQIAYWLFFDSILNVLRKKALFYVGINDPIDRFLRGTAEELNMKPELFAVILKLGLLLAYLTLIV